MTSSLLERVRSNAQEAGLPVEPEPKTWDADLIPDPGPMTGAPESSELNAVLDGVDILQAYELWCGKMTPQPGSRRESIMISCPIPGHEDAHPSAWASLENQTWYCGGCGTGGDMYDLAAYRHGFPVPEYKTSEHFPALRRAMTADLGYTTITTPTGREVTAPAPAPPSAIRAVPDLPSDTENVIKFPGPDDALADAEIPTIDWRKIVPAGTFLRDYLDITCETDLPDEYHFWCALQLLATSGGKQVSLRSVPDIYPNLFVCLLGPSGIGKSRAYGMALSLLADALPYDYEIPDTTGTKLAPNPGSGEALLDGFSRPDTDPDNPKKIYRHCSVRGIVRFNEMTSLTSKANRTGNTLKPTLIDLYDGGDIAQQSRTSGLIEVKEPFCQVISTTQPKAIREVLAASDADSGFINRWVFAVGPMKPPTAHYTRHYDLGGLVEPLRRLRSWSAVKRRMDLSGKALVTWEEFFHEEIAPIKTDGDELPLLTRCDLTMLKLMVIFAINEQSEHPTVKHVEAAISLWPYLKASYSFVGSEIGIGEVDACAKMIVDCIGRHEGKYGRPPSVSDLYRTYLKRRFSMEIVRKALGNLVSLQQIDEIIPVTQGTPGGRPAIRYTLRQAG